MEDTVNLLGHAARKVVECAADLLGWSFEKIATAAGIPLLLQSSVKKGLDVEWSDPDAKAQTVDALVRRIESLEAWLREQLSEELKKPPLKEHVETLAQIRAQDLEPDLPRGAVRRASAKLIA